jgi:PAS domain S-box-containing protein
MNLPVPLSPGYATRSRYVRRRYPVTEAPWGGTTSASVLYVGEEVAAVEADGLAVRRVDADEVKAHAPEADCVVAEEPGGGVEVVAVVEDAAVPTVLYDRAGDPAVAARATRAGVTEYVADGALDGETLADRVAAVADADGVRAAGALESLHAVATDRSLSLDGKVERLLAVGRERLGLEVGFLTRVEGETLTFTAVDGSHPAVGAGASVPLSETHCRRTVEADGLLGIHDAVETGDVDDAADEASGLRCYLGGKVVVDGELYGTLCFGGEDPRERPFARRERRFVELLVEWLGYEIRRDRRERALRRYKAVHETVEEMVFVVSEGTRFELLTEPLVERFGYGREALLGEPAAELLDEEAVAAGYEAFEALQDGAESVAVETTVRTADGEEVPVEIELSLLSSATEFEGLVGVVRDRTELTETRSELEAERDRFQSLFERLPDAVVDAEFVDGEPRVRSVNPAFEDVFGYDARAVVGEPVDDRLVPPEVSDAPERLDDGAGDEGYNIAEVERRTADGRRTFLFRGFRYSTAGAADRGFGIYTDVTDRLEQERRLRVLHRVLRHNLRNEMTAIIGYSELLVERAADTESRGYADRILEQAEDVARLSQQVQRIERALDRDRRRVPLDPESVGADVAARCRECHPRAAVSVSGDGGRVVADELLECAVENLVENAIEHHDGAPTVELEVATVDDRWVDVTVRDDGPGIPERERAVVSGEREITQLDHSRGLGLWVARWIVEGVGGRLRFGDCEDGAEVTLRLQRFREEPAA